MGLSFTGEAAQNRDCGDHHHTRASSRIFPRAEYYAIQRNRTIRAKGDLFVMASVVALNGPEQPG
jgi:hypothetical protein